MRLHVSFHWHPALAILVFLSWCWLSACQSTGTSDAVPEQASQRDTLPPDRLFALFEAQAAPIQVPLPGRNNAKLPPPDIQVYNAYLVGKEKFFPTSSESAFVPYLRLTLPNTSPFQALVMLEERADGPHYWLLTVTPAGKLIDRREIAFNRIATGVEHDRTATIRPDLRVDIAESLRQRTVARDSIELQRMGKPMVETVTTGSFSLQVRPDGTFVGTLPAAPAPADTTR